MIRNFPNSWWALLDRTFLPLYFDKDSRSFASPLAAAFAISSRLIDLHWIAPRKWNWTLNYLNNSSRLQQYHQWCFIHYWEYWYQISRFVILYHILHIILAQKLLILYHFLNIKTKLLLFDWLRVIY